MAKFIVDIHIYCTNKKQFCDAVKFMAIYRVTEKVTEG